MPRHKLFLCQTRGAIKRIFILLELSAKTFTSEANPAKSDKYQSIILIKSLFTKGEDSIFL